MPTSSSPRGLVPVLQLPFTSDHEIDVDGFERLLDDTLRYDIGGVFFPGIASEFYTLDDAERALLTRVLLRRTRELDDVRAVVSITDQSTTTVLRRAHEALDWGADVINVMTPRFWPLAATEVEAFFDEVLDQLAPAPVMIQYASDVSAVGLTPLTVQNWARRHPNLSCVKVEVDYPGPFIRALVEGDPAVDALVGKSGLQLIDALEHGATGVQPVTGFLGVYERILAHWTAGRREEARRLYERLLPYVVVWESVPGLMITVAKEIAWRRGLLDTPVCRTPRTPMSRGVLAMVDRFLVEMADELDPLVPNAVGVNA